MKKAVMSLLAASLLVGCATGDTPAAKKANARKDTQEALQAIYKDHPGAKTAVNKAYSYLVCTGSDSYIFAASSGGGVCTYHKAGSTKYYRFASLGAGLGIGFKKVAFVYAFHDKAAMKRFETSGWDAGAKADATARADDQGDQAAANASFDVDGVKIYQSAIWGAAAQATLQGYKFWETDFTDDFVSMPE
ncbi:lipid-binding SYLF domain-containing protein [Enterovibrio coralii]|uniref:Ysc84 actin-binding domain-containing protein n=1 Tax=Enterovibrio coralii TaxID=294935 RepID=A0A135I9W3_9GAMM|nr:hypothetical protein [Enterovibrio coralii]KXF82240.1 hypothetical protein ATN88_24075 [Enterovibrio coralii]